MKKKLLMAAFVLAFAAPSAGVALADPSPNGPGEPGAPATTCGDTNPTTPGASMSAQCSRFNQNGHAVAVYAGNPGTASLANANSINAASQYDVACVQLSD